MTPESPRGDVLILTPIGRDASTSAGLIKKLGLHAKVCADLAGLQARLEAGTDVALIAEEALYGKDLRGLAAWVEAQAPWSDQPFLVLTNKNTGLQFANFRRALVDTLRNVAFLERPLQTITLQAAVLSAERARLRQYEARAYLERQSQAALELERLVCERTSELEQTNRRLHDESARREQAQTALLQAQKIETMGQLVGGVAHDFNNLLMAVMGNLDLLAKGLGSDPRLNRLLNGAMEGARRGATLTQRLLAFARKQELQSRPTDVLALIEDMRTLMDRSLGPLVRIELKPTGRLPDVTVDPNQLEMALLNLAVNARDAMPSGGVFTISLQGVDLDGNSDPPLAAGRYLRLSVADTGQGMDAVTLAKAIEPFFSTKGVGKGTGLGLSMVHGLADQSGGAFRLQSAPGAGTTAILWLPAAASAAISVETAPSPTQQSAPAVILLVDDDALIAASTCALLEDLGHEVVGVSSGQEALALMQGGLHPDLVITDHAMPGMTGMELAQHILSDTPDMPILLATGFAELPPGQTVHLPRLAKPYTQAQLASELSHLLQSRR